jgi:alpha-L-rhamnosidase
MKNKTGMICFSRPLFLLIFSILFISSITFCENNMKKKSTVKQDLKTANFKPVNLRCEYLVNPISIDAKEPRLSWIFETKERNQKQTAYQILVAGSLEKLKKDDGDLWNSGKIETDQSNNIPYKGKTLNSRMECYWQVRIWDKNGMESVSEPAYWRMGILSNSEWKAKWIGLHNDAPETMCPPASFLRKEFNTAKAVKKATVYSTAQGIYELYLNGKRIGNDLFAPGWTDYRARIQYQTYDVTKLLNGKKNSLGAILGDGWYASYIGYLNRRANYGNQTRLFLELHIEYNDGKEEVIASDESWKCSAGPIISSDFLMGEEYDARKELSGWDKPDYDDSKWSKVEVMKETKSLLVAQPCESVQITEYLKPKKVTQPYKGTYIFDLGQNMVGFVKIKVKGEAGTIIKIRHAEMLNPDGTIYITNLRSARATDVYILKGKGEEVFQPHFTFHGFRYVEVTGYPGKPGNDAITGCAINSALPITGKYECSNPMVNQLQSNINWGQRGNFVSIPTDCPQRDERLGWMGDAQIFVRTAATNMDVSGFFTKWIRDIRDAQSKAGGFTDITPNIGTLVAENGAPAWADAGIIVPWTIYLVYNDTRVIEEHFEAMVKYMNYIFEENKNYLRKNRLNNNYGDWLSIKADTPKDLLATAYWANDAFILSKMAKVIGKNDEAAKYAELYNQIKSAFQKEYIAEDGQIKGNTQTGYLLALYNNLYPENLREKAAKLLIADIEKKDWHLSTGFLGVRILNPVLTEMGYPDIAYRLLNNTTFPSWGYSIKHGATTIWERWDGWTKENGFQDPGMNSFNHYSLGSVGEWLYRYSAGIDIDPEKPGYKHIIIRPYPGGELKYVKAEYESINGKILSHWKQEKDLFSLNLTIPGNTTATLYLPSSDVESVKESGKDIKTNNDIKFVKYEKGFVVYEIGSGEYRFSSTLKK